jgi:DNA invertase Pin-like site-specific DNA recombinase
VNPTGEEQDMWWVRAKPAERPPERPRAVAYYRHSAQDRQENSVSIQQEQVRQWAQQNGVEIVQEFADRGKSGLTAEGRDGFNDMMENWVKKNGDFDYVLCLDVSRWGRFQDIDLSATYSAECKKHGKQVVYTTIGKPRDGDPLYPVYVQFERFRAAQYSKELSDKVFRGCVRISQQGYWAGGAPPFGMQRMLLSETREPLQILASGERKSIQNQRVTLTAGDDREIETVRRIFREFTEGGRQEQAIADGLNNDGITSARSGLWDGGKIRHVLTYEPYMGTLVYNRTTSKLKTPTRHNPPEKWVRTPGAFEPIVDKDVFGRARQIFEDRALTHTPEFLIQRLREVWRQHGLVRPSLLRADGQAPSAGTYAKRFSSLDAACQMAFRGVLVQAKMQVEDRLRAIVADVKAYEDFLVINGRFTVLVRPAMPMQYGYSEYWFLQPDSREVVDITLSVPVSSDAPHAILGYLVLPRLLMSDKSFRLFSSSESQLDMYGHNGLEMIKQLTL